MKHDISLLTSCFKIRKPIPFFKIMSTGYSGSSNSRGEISSRSSRVFSLRTKDTINPSVFMPCKAHVINVCIRIVCFRHGYRVVPEPEIINSIRTFCDSKKGFPVIPLNTNSEYVFPFKLHCTCIECCMNAKAFHQVRICYPIEVISPV